MLNIRNVAIIAHVDHGKTTLVDNMLKQSGTFRVNQVVAERVMDSNDLERERGITILAKCTSLFWKDTRINIVDTPGHADFGGEVERILSMVDGVILLVDAAEGVMPQTKFVLSKALKLGLKPIVIVNKIDRHDSRIDEVLDEVIELFMVLEANDDQLGFPVIYASGRSGWAIKNLEDNKENLNILFDTILDVVSPPKGDANEPFSMLVTTREYNAFLGRMLTGRISSGVVKVNQQIKVLNREGKLLENARISKILSFRGLEQVPVEEAYAGDIVVLAGIQNATVTDTICAVEVNDPLPSLPIDPPTLSVKISANDSPLSGKEGAKVTLSSIGERLMREIEGNVALRVKESDEKDSFEVSGRGELQLGVLIETMRREGFELSISRPRVLYTKDEKGNRLEPIEEVQIDVDEPYVGQAVEAVSLRKGELQDMRPSGGGKTRIVFHAPARGLIGYHGQFLNDTRGTGIMNRVFYEYAPYKGPIESRRNGALISNGTGQAVAYALWNLEDRGKMFIKPQENVYTGMIIGEHNRDNDLEINPLKAKQLSNVRASGKDEAIKLSPPTILTLEQAIAYIKDDELVEVTPKSIRLRKRYLDATDRKRYSKSIID